MSHRRWIALGVFIIATLLGAVLAVAHTATPNPILATLALGGSPVPPPSLAIDTSTGHAFIASLARRKSGPVSEMRIIDPRRGTLLRTIVVGVGLPTLSVDRARGLVLVASTDSRNKGRLLILDGTSGALLRVASFGAAPITVAVDSRLGRAFVLAGQSGSCSPAGCTGSTGAIYAFDERTLRLLRTNRVGALPHGLQLDERTGRIFVGDGDGVQVFDAGTGQRLYALRGPANVLAIDQSAQWLLMGNSREMSLAIRDERTGRLVGKLAAPDRSLTTWGVPFVAATDPPADAVLVLDAGVRDGTGAVQQPGTLQIITGRAVPSVRALRVGGAPSALVVDTRRQRAFVANTADSTISVVDIRGWRVERVIALPTPPVALALDERGERLLVESAYERGPHRPDVWWWLPAVIRSKLPFLAAPPAPTEVNIGSVSVVDVNP